MILQMTFTVDEDGEITDSALNVIPCSISSTSSYNDYQPTILEGDEAQEVMEKIITRSQSIADTYDVQAVYTGEE